MRTGKCEEIRKWMFSRRPAHFSQSKQEWWVGAWCTYIIYLDYLSTPWSESWEMVMRMNLRRKLQKEFRLGRFEWRESTRDSPTSEHWRDCSLCWLKLKRNEIYVAAYVSLMKRLSSDKRSDAWCSVQSDANGIVLEFFAFELHALRENFKIKGQKWRHLWSVQRWRR